MTPTVDLIEEVYDSPNDQSEPPSPSHTVECNNSIPDSHTTETPSIMDTISEMIAIIERTEHPVIQETSEMTSSGVK